MANVAPFSVVQSSDLDEYPFGRDVRLDSHHFIAWERRRWLNSSMRLKGTHECRSIYFDLINISFDQAPIGTLPDDIEELAKLALIPEGHFRALCAQPYGPLHRWHVCLSDGERRLCHPMVMQTVADAVARKEDNRAKNDAANAAKRRERLRSALTGFQADLAKNDAAVLWMDDWLISEGCQYRSASWIERAISAWSNHAFDLSKHRSPRLS